MANPTTTVIDRSPALRESRVTEAGDRMPQTPDLAIGSRLTTRGDGNVDPAARTFYPQHEGATEQQDTDLPSPRGQAGMQPRACGRSESDTKTDEGMPTDGAGRHTRESGCSSEEQETASPAESVAPLFSPTRQLRESDLREGARRLSAARCVAELVASGTSQRAAATSLGLSEKNASIWLAILRKNPNATAEDFAPRRAFSGRHPALRLPDKSAANVRRHKLATNHTAKTGSTREAIRIACSRGEVDDQVASLVAAREAAGQPLLPEAALRQLHIDEPTIRAARAPRNAWLEYVTSPGSINLIEDNETGEERLIRPGEQWTIDDGSINLLCIVPGLERPGDKCFDNFGVCVGRFQFLLVVDHRTRFVTGWSFTARPRDSYRAEDITATLQNAMMEHGAPRSLVLEHGVSASRLISDTLAQLGIRIERASSPHQKVVESVFNRLWTKLSIQPGQVGRFRGEEEQANLLLSRVRDGSVDPRGKLLELPAVLQALRDVVADHNAQWVNSARYGRWVPATWFSKEAPASVRPLSPRDAWMFSPRVTEPLKVNGFRVQTTVSIMPGHSIAFVFAAEWLSEFHGARVKLYFNPFSTECVATAVLDEAVGERRPGHVLGQLEQVDRFARFTRRAMGYGLDPDIGAEAAAKHAQSLRRHVAAVRTDGTAGAQTHEVRNGTGTVATAATGATAERAPQISPRATEPQQQRTGHRAADDPRFSEFLEED